MIYFFLTFNTSIATAAVISFILILFSAWYVVRYNIKTRKASNKEEDMVSALWEIQSGGEVG